MIKAVTGGNRTTNSLIEPATDTGPPIQMILYFQLFIYYPGFSLYGLYKAGAMEDIECTLVQILVFSALIVAVDPVAVSLVLF